MTTAPRLDVDIFSDENLENPWSAFRQIRDAGPVVHLEQELYDVFALGRFADVRAALRNWSDFSSAEGTGFNELANDATKTTVVGCDPPLHDQLRTVMAERLSVSEVRGFAGKVQAKADALVAKLVERRNFDAVKDLAECLVPSVLGELLGLSDDALLDRFARDGHAVFAMLGVPNRRTEEAFPALLDLLQVIGGLTKDDMIPGGIGWALYDAADRGDIPEDMCADLLINYVGPGFETTINAIGNAVWLLARDPDQWKTLRSDRSLAASAVNESLRMESPIQIWARYCPEDTEVAGTVIPGGSRVAILFGSANRDERHYPHPDHFDVARNPADHVAFGHGIHLCLGASLARTELTAVLSALADQVTALECEHPVRRINNTTRGLASLPVTVS